MSPAKLFIFLLFFYSSTSLAVSRKVAYDLCADNIVLQQSFGYTNMYCADTFPYGTSTPMVTVFRNGNPFNDVSLYNPNEANCPSNQTYDPALNECNTEIICTAGENKTIWIQASAGAGQNTMPTFYLKDDRVNFQSANTECMANCTYNVAPGWMSAGITNCIEVSGNTHCRVLATGTGGLCLTNTAIDASESPTNASPPNSQSDCPSNTTFDPTTTPSSCKVKASTSGCIRIQNGSEMCVEKPKKNCGTVNGVDVCVEGDTVVRVSGHEPSLSENGLLRNCIFDQAGKPVCINLPSTPSCDGLSNGAVVGFVTCFKRKSSSQVVGISNKLQSKTTSNVNSNPDGTSTKTTVTTSNVIGSSPKYETTTFNNSGDQISHTVTYGSGTSNGDSPVPGDSSDGADAPSYSFNPGTDVGVFDVASASSELLTAKTDFQTRFNQLRTEGFSGITSGVGSLPSYNLGVFYGQPLVFDFNRYKSIFDVLRDIVPYLGLVLGLIIIFR
jgi:hypothetical protein